MGDKKKSSQSKSSGEKIICVNKRAGFDYHIEKRYEAGMVLAGSEVKSLRDGKVQLVDSYAAFERDGVYLYKANISEYKQGGPYFNHIPTRKRKLLLHKREILNLKAQIEQAGFTLVPTRMYFKGGKAKVEIALAKGKTKGDKRQSEHHRDADRRIQAATRRDRRRD